MDCKIDNIIKLINTAEWWTINADNRPVDHHSTTDIMDEDESVYECRNCDEYFEDWASVQEHVFQQYTTCIDCGEMTIPVTEFGAAELCNKCED